MLVIDDTVVNVALPSIQADLGLLQSPSQVGGALGLGILVAMGQIRPPAVVPVALDGYSIGLDSGYVAP